MKGFSLKKDTEIKPGKKFGGFSLNAKKQSTKILNKVSVLGGDDQTNSKLGTKIAIDSVDDIKTNKDNDKEDDLIIQIPQSSNSWEARRKKAAVRSATGQDVPLIDEKKNLKFGINILQKSEPTDKSINGGTSTGSVFNSSLQEVSAGSDTTAASYEKVPVEKFGAAMLRGMGWKGDTKDTQRRGDTPMKPRLPFLGLGAKASADQEDPTYRQTSKNYVPLVNVDENRTRAKERDDNLEVPRDRSPRR